jgi:hypothetical protein
MEWTLVKSRGDSISSCAIIAVNDSFVELSRGTSPFLIPVDSVSVLMKRAPASWSGTGAAIGFVLIGISGAVVGADVGKKTGTGPFDIIDPGKIAAGVAGAIIGSAVGLVLGGKIGASFTEGEYEVHELSGRDHLDKVAIIRSLIINGG